ncbi:MAG: class II fructose-bisphosphate aldolase [Candidatus Paceibacterota bacterium]
MKKLIEYIREAEEKKTAIAHFNISNSEMLEAIWRAAYKLKVPVVVGVSEGERDFIGIKRARALVISLREEFDFPIFLNADHTYSLPRVNEVAEAKFDSVIFDGANLPFEENISKTKECVLSAKALDSEILVEGELGFIGQSSKLLDKIPEGVVTTSPDDAKRFVEETKVDLFAPAVGNFHGQLRVGDEPIKADLVKQIREVAGVPLVLHGGSGISDEDFIKAIDAGISMIHISTELRVAFRKGIEEAVKEMPDEVAPYKYLAKAVENVEKVAEARLKLFSKIK